MDSRRHGRGQPQLSFGRPGAEPGDYGRAMAMTTSTDSALQQLLDKQAIQDVIVRYCRGVDRGDAEMTGSAYHHDAVDLHAGQVFDGGNVGEGLRKMTESFSLSFHHMGNHHIEFDGPDVARCESYYSASQVVPSPEGDLLIVALGRYLDLFERRDGEWKIAHRRVVVDHAQRMPATERHPDAPLGARDRSDPSYQFFAGS